MAWGSLAHCGNCARFPMRRRGKLYHRTSYRFGKHSVGLLCRNANHGFGARRQSNPSDKDISLPRPFRAITARLRCMSGNEQGLGGPATTTRV